MIIKFCYKDEIHRCSDPPKDYASLNSFLISMFRTPIPSQIDLYYINPEGQTMTLNSEDDYQGLMRSQPTKPVKVVISEGKSVQEEIQPLNGEFDRETAEYEVIPHYSEEHGEEMIERRDDENIIELSEEKEGNKEPIHQEQEQKIEEKQQDQFSDLYDNISDKISEKYIIPQVQNSPTMQPAQIKNLVKEALREEMPYIIAQVKESLIKTGQVPVPSRPVEVPEPQSQPTNRLPMSYQAYYSYPYCYPQPINRVNSYPGQFPVPQVPPQRPGDNNNSFERVPQGMIQVPQVNVNNNSYRGVNHEQVNQAPPQQATRPHLFDKVVKALSRPMNKATEMVDNLVHKIEGDPYVYCAEGKYNKSVVDKVAHLKEIFPDEDKKELLDFAQRFPRDAPLDQLAEVYWSKKKMT